jgi:hypothetical protein
VALGVVSVGPQNPTARVEYALRADESLSEPQVRQIMEYYLAVRVRRFGRSYGPMGGNEAAVGSGSSGGSNGGNGGNGGLYGRPANRPGSVATPAVVRTVPAAPRYGAPRGAIRPPVRTTGRP